MRHRRTILIAAFELAVALSLSIAFAMITGKPIWGVSTFIFTLALGAVLAKLIGEPNA